mgnify:CR=1 FL=1
MEMGKKLRELRTSKHLSVYRISQDTGLSPNHIRALERGERNPSLETLSRLCVPLGISLLELLCEDEEVSYLSEKERTLVEYFRTLPESKADLMLMIAKTLNE